MTQWSFINAPWCLTDLSLVLRVRVSRSSLQSLATSKNSNKKGALFQEKQIYANSNERTREKRTLSGKAVNSLWLHLFLMVKLSYKWDGLTRPYIYVVQMLSSHGGKLGYWITRSYRCGAGSWQDVKSPFLICFCGSHHWAFKQERIHVYALRFDTVTSRKLPPFTHRLAKWNAEKRPTA